MSNRKAGILSLLKYDLILFDLDGTLVHTADDIVDSLLHVLAELGHPPLPREKIVASIGHGVRRLVEQTTPPPHDQILDRFMAHYGANCLVRTSLYPGVIRTLEQIPARKIVLTNKPEAMSRTILSGLGILHYFEQLYGGDTLPVRKPNPEVIRLTTGQSQSPILIGDSGVDVQTARNAGIPVIAVTYGYHHPGDLEPANHQIDQFSDLLPLIQ
jgi:phosphoglycolate phosphatase